MPHPKVIQLSLFPARDSVKQVVAEGLAQLPITNENELITLLRLHENTILKQRESQNGPT